MEELGISLADSDFVPDNLDAVPVNYEIKGLEDRADLADLYRRRVIENIGCELIDLSHESNRERGQVIAA